VRLIDDLLDVSRVTQGKIELRKQAIQAVDVVRSALEASQPLIEAAGHSLTVKTSPDAIWLDADLTRLAQVVSNLLNNAAKYTPEGGRITLSVERDGDEAEITVTDNGLGIPLNMQSRVFELFTQIDYHDGRAKGGLGIGLALVRRLVAMHGGSVALESPGVGKGSRFTVRLPIADASLLPPLPEVEAPSQSAPASRSLKVLVVDDNEAVAQTVGLMLEEIGHTYHLADDGRAALRAAETFGPDVIVLDIGLPGMDGYAVCRAFRRDERFKKLTIIAQTGWGRERDKVLASEAGFDYHLVKPVSLADLELLLAEIAAKSEGRN